MSPCNVTPSKEQASRCLRLLEAISILGIFALVASIYSWLVRSKTRYTDPEKILRVRGLVVVDENGMERVRIGAPLPDPPFLGKRGQRQGPVSGILLMDADGTERSGYVTDENGQVYLTLDNKARQAAQFLANESTGVNLQMWDEKGNRVILMVLGDAPHLEVVQQGKTMFQQPSAAGGEK
jgi:hypothetical protein